MPNWLSAGQYAASCGIQTRSVHLRIKRGVICAIMVDGVPIIDVAVSAPKKLIGRTEPKAKPFSWPVFLPAAHKLVRVSTYCERNNIRGHNLYTAIVCGEVPAYVLGGMLFIENLPDLKRFINPRKKRY